MGLGYQSYETVMAESSRNGGKSWMLKALILIFKHETIENALEMVQVFKLSNPASNDMLLPGKPYLLNPAPPAAPAAGDRFKYTSL